MTDFSFDTGNIGFDQESGGYFDDDSDAIAFDDSTIAAKKKPVPVIVSEGEILPVLQVETDADDEQSEVLTGFRQRAKRDDNRYWDAVDSEFWVAVCFQSREQKEEFLTKVGLIADGDKYLDGMLVAEKLGVILETPIESPPQVRPFDRFFESIALDE